MELIHLIKFTKTVKCSLFQTFLFSNIQCFFYINETISFNIEINYKLADSI